ncbi:hypothetical protein [Nonomuraea jabiensis]|uniref:Uncharacterized protein n=1 Tax=Nonomuraea jabiensis TaxID=882448 RepID=A0A7W9LGU0_9ACTN|nr:hypothetical protein [Nonomuraea jabiensis]MBB5783311.1 hypothetical protein [Nonomuraea jabiensis]
MRRLTGATVMQRGWVDEAEIEVFLAAGHTRAATCRTSCRTSCSGSG